MAAQNQKLGGFAEQDIEKRISPALSLPGVKSIVVLAMPYRKKLLVPPDDKARGHISQSALGEDYHRLLKAHLEAVAAFFEPHEYRAYVDTGPLVDRAVACRAGLGSLGKNQSLLTPGGSMYFIGYLLTTRELAPTPHAAQKVCGACTRCLRACPAGALSEEGFAMEKCISYLTQKKGLLTLEEMRSMGRQLYGCDVCQLACPHNRGQGEPFSDLEAAMPQLEELLSISEKEFWERFGSTAAGWRGRRIFQRNAVIALFNQGGDIAPYRAHPAELVRQTVARLEGR